MPKKLTIIHEPHPFLRQIANPVEDVKDPTLPQFVDDMIFTMRKSDGIGLAAPQVHISKRIIVVDTRQGAMEFINPEIIDHSKDKALGEEGCLSVPGEYGMVKRYDYIKVKSYDKFGEEQIHEAKGMFARVIQHEIDHLNGILFIDKVENYTTAQLDQVSINT